MKWRLDFRSACLGFFSSALLNLIFAVGPDKAIANLHSWSRALFG